MTEGPTISGDIDQWALGGLTWEQVQEAIREQQVVAIDWTPNVYLFRLGKGQTLVLNQGGEDYPDHWTIRDD